MRTLTVSLTPEQAARLEQAVESGSYASSSEIVRDALLLWEEREELRARELEHLRQAYETGRASGAGESVDRADFLARLKAERGGRG